MRMLKAWEYTKTLGASVLWTFLAWKKFPQGKKKQRGEILLNIKLCNFIGDILTTNINIKRCQLTT